MVFSHKIEGDSDVSGEKLRSVPNSISESLTALAEDTLFTEVMSENLLTAIKSIRKFFVVTVVISLSRGSTGDKLCTFTRWRSRTIVSLRDLWELVQDGYDGPDDLATVATWTASRQKEFKENKKKDAKALLFIQQGAINPLELAMLKEIQSRFYRDFPAHLKEQVYEFATPSMMKPTQ